MTIRRFILSLGFILRLASAGLAQDFADTIIPDELRAKDGGRIWVYLPTPQIQECVAYAPIIDREARLGRDTLKALDSVSPGIAKLLHDASPPHQSDAFRCPVFRFRAADDTSVPATSIVGFRDAFFAHRKHAEYVSVSSGGHYDSMVEQGIPKAITWLKSLGQKRDK